MIQKLLDNIKLSGIGNGRKGQRIKLKNFRLCERVGVDFIGEYGEKAYIFRICGEPEDIKKDDKIIWWAQEKNEMAVLLAWDYRQKYEPISLRVRCAYEFMMPEMKDAPNNGDFLFLPRPVVSLTKYARGMAKAEIKGFEIYNPITDKMEMGGIEEVVEWSIDTDWDGECHCPEQVFFPGYDGIKANPFRMLEKRLEKIDFSGAYKYHSRPFRYLARDKISVKAVNLVGETTHAIVSYKTIS